MRRAKSLPNLLTLGNAFLGLLAISKAIDALVLGTDAGFAALFETACWFILGAMLLDGLDGRVARMTDSFSDLGAQLDSFADAVTFGVAPALLAKVMLEHHGILHPRLNFFVAALYSLMAIMRLARFNVASDHDEESHRSFRGLPSPAAAGTLVATMMMSQALVGGSGEGAERTTPMEHVLALIPETLRMSIGIGLQYLTFLLLPALALLMVSKVKYTHAFSRLMSARGRWAMVRLVLLLLFLALAPVLTLFILGWVYLLTGLLPFLRQWRNGTLERNETA